MNWMFEERSKNKKIKELRNKWNLQWKNKDYLNASQNGACTPQNVHG